VIGNFSALLCKIFARCIEMSKIFARCIEMSKISTAILQTNCRHKMDLGVQWLTLNESKNLIQNVPPNIHEALYLHSASRIFARFCA